MDFDNRPIFEEEHKVFRENFRRFCEEEIVPHQEKWIEI